MLSAAGNDYGKSGKDSQTPTAYESSFGAVMSKKNGVRRVKFADTDNNSADSVAADYSVSNVNGIFPRCVANGEWDDYTVILQEIGTARERLPRFYAAYCTEDSAAKVTEVIAAIDEALANEADTETLSELVGELESAESSLVFRSDERVPQIFIATDKGNGESYGTTLTKSIGYVSAQVTCVDAGGEVIVSDNSWSSQVKVRGNATASGAKKPYNVKFSSKVDLFGMGKAKKWCLLADYYDPSLMRNRVALELGKKLGLDATTDFKRVEVWVDGEYRGLYLLTEKIEADDNRVDINTKNGDFLVELDWVSRTEKGNIYLTTSSGRYYRLREPEDEKKIDVVKAKLDEFEETLKSGTWEQVIEYTDIDSFVSYYILNEFAKSIDFHQLSVYFYCKDGKIYGGPSWDYDNSMGNYPGRTYQGIVIDSPEGLYAKLCHYYAYLFNYPEFKLAVSQRLQEVYNSGLFEQMYSDGGQIDSDAEFYAEAISRNYKVWKFTVASNRTKASTYDGELRLLKTWLASRDVWLQDNTRYGIYDGCYYVFGEKNAAGFFNYDGSYYYAGENGLISTGNFTINNNSYTADQSGRILPQSLNLTITAPSTLSTDYGQTLTQTLTHSLSAHYGQELDDIPITDGYSLTWSVSQVAGVTLNDSTLTIAPNTKPGTYALTVSAQAASGDLTASAQTDITLTVSNNSGSFVPNDDAVPQFAYQSLMLEGQTGVNFYMYLPELEGVNYSDGSTCWMDFLINGETLGNSQVLDEEFAFTENGNTYYGFRCYVNVLQMADTITATFHYGNSSITRDYSVREYLDSDFSSSSAATQELIAAIKDYGHYSQLLLAKEHGLTPGQDYAELPAANSFTNEEMVQIASDVEDYAFTSGNTSGSGVEGFEYSLSLESSTAVNLYVNLEEGYTGSLGAYLDGGSLNIADKVSSNRYRVTIDDIPAHELGRTFTITIKAASTFDVKLSAMSYASTVMRDFADDKEMCEASAALFRYYDATMNYREEQDYND